MYSIGVDLGGTKLHVAVVDNLGRVFERRLVPTNVRGGADGVREQIVQAIRELIEEKGEKPAAIGLGLAGQVDAKSGLVYFAPNLQWHNVPIKEMLEKDLHIPIAVTNDVRAATWGEWQIGAGKNCSDLVCLFVGTGLGGGIVSKNQMLTGATNSAGEIGHMVIQMGGRHCHCGQYGCFEAYASGWAIAERAQDLMKLEAVTAKDVAHKYKEGDPLAAKVVEEVVLALIAGSVSIVNCLNHKRLIFGGGVIKGLPEILKSVEEGIKKQALKSAASQLEVTLSELSTDAGVIGAAVFARCLVSP
jgi:glucokinase